MFRAPQARAKGLGSDSGFPSFSEEGDDDDGRGMVEWAGRPYSVA
jgi:hypothetical protein